MAIFLKTIREVNSARADLAGKRCLLDAKSVARTEQGTLAAQKLIQYINGREKQTIRRLLAASGAGRIYVTDDIKENVTIHCVYDAAAQQKLSRRIDRAELAVGDLVFGFDPSFLAGFNAAVKRTLVEHELFHYLIIRAMPDYHSAYLSMWDRLAEVGLHFVSYYFGVSLDHFFLTQAAMEVGRKSFAVKDAQWRLARVFPLLDKLRPYEITAFGTGILFSYYYAFKCQAGDPGVGDKNLEEIRQQITKVAGEEGFMQCLALAESIFKLISQAGDYDTGNLKEITNFWIKYGEEKWLRLMDYTDY